MSLPLFIVDAFADNPFRGNPAAVCLLGEESRATSWMQSVASEMNLSETAFVQNQSQHFGLRWFTPKAEVTLCGHATLASAKVLCETGLVAPDQRINFRTLSGGLHVVQRENLLEMDFPAIHAKECDPPTGLAEALGAELHWVGRNEMDYLVQVKDEKALRGLRPRFEDLGAIEIRGVAVTALSETDECDFVSRYFAPAFGINEDPVTGSAHCALAPFWASKLDRQKMVGYQASERGGIVRVEVKGDRVLLSGNAIITAKGTLLV